MVGFKTNKLITLDKCNQCVQRVTESLTLFYTIGFTETFMFSDWLTETVLFSDWLTEPAMFSDWLTEPVIFSNWLKCQDIQMFLPPLTLFQDWQLILYGNTLLYLSDTCGECHCFLHCDLLIKEIIMNTRIF
jgi:hypothetical protein